MIRTSIILHKSVLNFTTSKKGEIEDYSDLNFGNTLSLITGDYLLSNSFRELANLRNFEVNELMSASVRDLAEGEFIKPRDQQNRPIPAIPASELKDVQIPNNFDLEPFEIKDAIGHAKAEWTLRHFLSGGSLLARSCQASLKLARHDQKFQQLGYLFGRNMALAWQAHFDLESIEKGSFSLISAPVMFHLQSEPSFYAEILKGSENVAKCDYESIRKIVNEGSGISKTVELKQEFIEKSLQVLEEFKESNAKDALKNLIQVL